MKVDPPAPGLAAQRLPAIGRWTMTGARAASAAAGASTMIASAAMTFSSVSVIANALRLRRLAL